MGYALMGDNPTERRTLWQSITLSREPFSLLTQSEETSVSEKHTERMAWNGHSPTHRLLVVL
jgi:hypothetical protein